MTWEEKFDNEFPNEDFREDMNNGERERYFLLRDIKVHIRSQIIKPLIDEIPKALYPSSGEVTLKPLKRKLTSRWS